MKMAETFMRLVDFAIGTVLMGLVACAPPSTGPALVAESTSPQVAMSPGTGTIDANGRATGLLLVNGFGARRSSAYPACLILVRPGSDGGYQLQNPGAFIGLGGECPTFYWRATARSLEELGQGIIVVEGIGRCRIPREPVAWGTSGVCTPI